MARLTALLLLSAGLLLGRAPLKVLNGFGYAEVVVNGKGPFRMLVDSGATSCSLTPGAAELAGLAPDERVVVSTVAGDRTIRGSRTVQIQVGDTIDTNVEVLVQDVQKAGMKIDGILGQSFLGREPYLIDYRGKQLLLGYEARRQGLELPIGVEARLGVGRPVLAVNLDGAGEAWNLVLDSGASDLLVLCSTRCPNLKPVSSGLVSTNAGTRTVDRVRTKGTRVGGMSLAGMDGYVMHSPPEGHEEGVLPANRFGAVYVDSEGGVVRLGR